MRTQRRARDPPSAVPGREPRWSGPACSSDALDATKHEVLLGADLVVVAVDRFSAEAGDAPVAVSAHRSSGYRRLYVLEQVGAGDESSRRRNRITSICLDRCLHPRGRMKSARADDRDVELSGELFGLREIESFAPGCQTFRGAFDDWCEGQHGHASAP